VEFHPGPCRAWFVDGDRCAPVAPTPTIERSGDRVVVAWRTGAGSRVSFAAGPFVAVEAAHAGGWVPFAFMGRSFDDREAALLVESLPAGGPSPLAATAPSPDSTETWEAKFTLRRGAGDARPLRVRVSPRDEFPGFAIAVPPTGRT
jgi:hypothetical protein